MAVTPADAPLLATKLFVPSARQNRVSRARLCDQLEGARGGTVTLVAAPAGSGKSTLLADWAAGTERHVAWISLDASDDEPRRFMNYVIAALKNGSIISSADAFSGLSMANAGGLDTVVTELLNAVAQRQVPAALVLDDYHVIESESVHGIVQRIIDRIPPNLHLVLATRADPPLALSRIRARDLLLEIRASDLRFTEDEAGQFLNEAMGLSLTRDQVVELDRRTEGWAVGLQMAAISLRGRTGAKTFIASFSGSNRYVLDYLTDEVLHGQTGEVRAFLLETAIAERLCPSLCNAITGRNDSERILAQLDAANLFLIPLDDVRYWYRYHHLFGSLLQHELERTRSAGEIAELHRRASAWYASNGMPEPALHHAVAAHDDDRAIAIVSEHGTTHIVAGDGGTIVRWIAHLPRNRVENNFDLLMLHALAFTAEYRLEDARDELKRAERIMPADKRSEGAVLSMRGTLERMLGTEPERSTETLERAMTLLDPNDFWYSMSSFHLGIGAMMRADLRNAERYLEESTAYRDQPDGLLTAVLGKAYGAWCRIWRGFPEDAAVMATEANNWIEAWASKHGTGRPLESLTFSVLGDIHRLRNNSDRAREYAQIALDRGRTGFFIGYAEASRVMAQVAEAQGDFEAALTAATELACAVRCAGNVEGMGPIHALEYWILWRRGKITGDQADIEKVAQWCKESGFLSVGDWPYHLHVGLYRDYSLLIGARVLLHQKRYEEAERLIDSLLEESLRLERVPTQITLLVLESLLEVELGHGDAAVAAMTRALDTAASPRFIRPFLDEGTAVLPILERAAVRAHDRDFATQVLSAFAVPVKIAPALPSQTEALSDRELEVLQLIAGGASNQDAARKLFVAPSTVKKHLENIYAKLGVGGRTQAVARARELRIL